jgi:CRP-like cAMP-binding protein
MLNLNLLQKIPYFAGLDPKGMAIHKLQAGTTEAEFEEKQLLFLEGEPSQGLYFLAEGQIRVFKSGSRGKEQNLHLVGPGTTFNDVPALDGGVNPASAQALELSSVLIIPTPLFQELFEAEPAVSRCLAQNYAARLRQMTTLAADISLKHVTARIAKILLNQTRQETFEGEDLNEDLNNEVNAQLTQQQMAAMAGTVREMVGRSLRSMESSGAIEARRGYILIKDKTLLASLANL